MGKSVQGSPYGAAQTPLGHNVTEKLAPCLATPKPLLYNCKDMSAAGGAFVPDAATDVSVPKLSIQRPFKAAQNDFHDDVHVHLSKTLRTAAVAVYNVFHQREEKQVALYHLPTARRVAEGTLPAKTNILAVSDRGDQLYTTTGWPTSKVDAIQIWTAKDGKLEATGGWRSAGGRQMGIRSVQTIPGERLLMTAGEFAVVWEIASATATHSFPIHQYANPLLSANRRNAAFIGKDNHIYVIDLSNMAVVRALAYDKTKSDFRQLAFDPTGTRLAASSAQHVTVWDLETGMVARDCPMVRLIGTNSLRWLDPDHLLLDGGKLLHLPTGATVWNYELPKSVTDLGNGQLWALRWSAQGGNLTSVTAPHDEVRAKTASLSKDQLIRIQPGSAQVTLGQVHVDGGQIHEELRKRLERAGYQLGGSGDLKIEIRSEKGKTQTEGVKDFFSGPFGAATDTITFTPTTIHWEVSYKGHTLSKSSRTYTCPSTIHLEKGETPQAAATRHCTPKVGSYTNVFIPGNGLLLPNGSDSFGSSKLLK